MTSSVPKSGKVVDLGILTNESNFTVTGSVAPDETIEYFFDVGIGDTIYSNFELYDFSDDLDLNLYRWNTSDTSWDFLQSSEGPDDEPESIFKVLSEGSYSLDVFNYSDINNDGGLSSFSLDIDAETWITAVELPNDPLFNKQWHLFNTGQGSGIDNLDIFAPEAWAIANKSPNVTVAVIDGGVDIKHEDLIDNLWINPGEIPNNDIDDDNNGLIDDYHGWNFASNEPLRIGDNHGTHVAGTIGAEGNNNIGVTGVTWDVNLMSLDVFQGDLGGSNFAIISAIYYAVEYGADVINLSLGADYNLNIDEYIQEYPGDHSAWLEALTYAVDNGVSVVIAAGNEDLDFDGNWVSSPAYFSELIPGVISVASVANNGQRAYYSNYGSDITIGAPGGSFFSSGEFNDQDTIFATSPIDPQLAEPGDYQIEPMYGYMQGTSMAAPVVSGAIALLYEQNPYLTPVEVQSILQNSAAQRKDLEQVVLNGAFLDVEAALIMAGNPPYDCGDEVFRFYHPDNGVHFFTPSVEERDNIILNDDWGYRYEGVAYEAPSAGGTELFRFYNRDKGYHFMTANKDEADFITGQDWGYTYEGRSYQVSKTSTEATPNEVYRFYNRDRGIHFYSASESEANNVILNSLGEGYNLSNAIKEDNLKPDGWGYIYEGIAWYVTDC